MFDFGAKWTPATPLAEGRHDLEGVTVDVRTALHLAFISGNFRAGLAALGLEPQPIGATAIARPPAYALAAARDRVLVVSEVPLASAEGWNAEGFAVTGMDGGLVALDLEGARLETLLGQATSFDWNATSRSAAIQFAGHFCLASRIGDRTRLRLLVETSLVEYVRHWIASALNGGR
jgi:hypothetical protein